MITATPDPGRTLVAVRRAQLLVLAKEPVPGRVKTRLSPALTPQEAADVATACLYDTLAAVAATPVRRRTVVLEGSAGGWLPAGTHLLPQRDGDLGARLAGAFEDAWAAEPVPLLLIGMDTPQVTPDLLVRALDTLLQPGTDAVLGLAEDGGFWALGLRAPAGTAFDGVPMSTGSTGLAQRERLAALGLTTAELPVLRDVDGIADLGPVVARQSRPGHLAALLPRLDPGRAAA